MPGDTKFQTKVVSKQVGVARLSFATEDFLLEFMDITPGSVSIMGLMNDKENRVRLLIDKDLLDNEFYACHPCINTSSMKMYTKDILEKFLPAVGHEATVVEL